MSCLCPSVAAPVLSVARVQSSAAPVLVSSRAALAAQRAVLAREVLRECRLCAHNCGVDRLAGVAGKCRAGAHTRVFSTQIEAGDESELLPTYAIAFSGCDLRCEFCVTHEASWNPRKGKLLRLEEQAGRARAALCRGARTIMFLGGEPTIHLPDVFQFVSLLPDEAALVWKTNAHASPVALELSAGLFDVWLPDLKFGNDGCAERLAGIQNYCGVVRRNLLWASRDSDLIVRHVLLPGHLECCWEPIARWLAEALPGTKVSLREGYWPRPDASCPELRRSNSPAERRRALNIAEGLRLNLIS